MSNISTLAFCHSYKKHTIFLRVMDYINSPAKKSIVRPLLHSRKEKEEDDANILKKNVK